MLLTGVTVMSLATVVVIAGNALENLLCIRRLIIPLFFLKKASASNTLSFNTPALATVRTLLGLSNGCQRDEVLQSK